VLVPTLFPPALAKTLGKAVSLDQEEPSQLSVLAVCGLDPPVSNAAVCVPVNVAAYLFALFASVIAVHPSPSP